MDQGRLLDLHHQDVLVRETRRTSGRLVAGGRPTAIDEIASATAESGGEMGVRTNSEYLNFLAERPDEFRGRSRSS
jgi:hypothetical protein